MIVYQLGMLFSGHFGVGTVVALLLLAGLIYLLLRKNKYQDEPLKARPARSRRANREKSPKKTKTLPAAALAPDSRPGALLKNGKEEGPMLAYLAQNLPTLIGAAIVLAVLALVTVKMVRDHRAHKGGCGCGCDGCPNAGACHPK